MIKAIAIDDEPLALNIIEEYSQKSGFVELAGKFTSPGKALSWLHGNYCGLIFLDIQMPDLSGFEFIETLKSSPSVILSTAYENYALESYSFNITDYLLKPYSFGRFLKAVEKALSQNSNDKNDSEKPYITNNKLFVNLGGKIVGLDFEDIHFIKGESDYIEIKTSEKSFLVRDNLKKVQPMLEDFGFQRIHRSYIISLNKINSLENDTVEISKEKLPIGRSYKKLLLDSINRYRIG